MLKPGCLFTILLISNLTFGQKANSIELGFIGRYDKQADYTSRYFNRSYTNDTKLWGKSFGVNLNYNHSINKHITAKAGIGYYYLGIDKIRQTTPFNLIATGRNIDYQHPSGIQLLFATQKYHYDNLSLALGVAYNKPVSAKLDITAGGDFTYLLTFSQLYHLSYDNIKYRTNNNRALGFGIQSYLGAIYKFNKNRNYISPKLIVPVYQQLNGDPIFGEDESVKMSKWMNGIGISLSVGRYL